MHLSNPLETLLRPSLASVLLALHRVGQGMTGRQVARVVGLSPSATLTLLQSAVGTGLVHARADPHATTYSVNREHLLWAPVLAIIDARDRLDDLIRAETAEIEPTATVLLYGSTARHLSRPESDVDVLVVFPDRVELADRDAFAAHLGERIATWTGNRAEILDVTSSELTAMAATDDPIVASLRRDARLVHGTRPSVLEDAA